MQGKGPTKRKDPRKDPNAINKGVGWEFFLLINLPCPFGLPLLFFYSNKIIYKPLKIKKMKQLNSKKVVGIVCISCGTEFSLENLGGNTNKEIKILDGYLNIKCPNCSSGTLRDVSFNKTSIYVKLNGN